MFQINKKSSSINYENDGFTYLTILPTKHEYAKKIYFDNIFGKFAEIKA